MIVNFVRSMLAKRAAQPQPYQGGHTQQQYSGAPAQQQYYGQPAQGDGDQAASVQPDPTEPN